MQFDVTVVEAEDLLFAEFYVWEHTSGAQDISTEEYHVPTHIREHIDYITPGTRLRGRSAKMENRNTKMEKRGVLGGRPFITELPGFPHPNSSVCDIFVTAECTRGMFFSRNALSL